MFAAPPKEMSRHGSSQTRDKDVTGPASKVEKKSRSPPEVTLPPLCPEPRSVSAAKSLFSRSPVFKTPPSDSPPSLVELPRLIAQVGAERDGVRSVKWKEGPRLMTSALGTDIPLSVGQSRTEKDESIKVTPCKDQKIITARDGKSTKASKCALAGVEVVQVLARKRDLGDFEIYYLKEVDADAHRPYDLRVVHSGDAGSEHYIFSSNTVLHVTETGYGGAVSLAEWYREYLLWTALQEIPFFRGFRLQKAFSWWHKNVRSRFFQRKRKKLQDALLTVVPQFRNGLHLFAGVIEELKGTRWSLDDSKTYTLQEFKNILISKDRECLQVLKKLSQRRAVILNMVKEGCYKTHHELQLQVQLAKKQNRSREPIHLLLSHQRKLKKELSRAESTLRKLGKFAALVHQMIAQTLVTIIQRDAVSFLAVLKRRTSEQRCLFHTELCVGADARLTLEPPTRLFRGAVSEALLTSVDSVIQMCDSSGLFLEISSRALGSAQDLTPDFSSSLTTGETKSDGRVLRDVAPSPEETFQMVQGNTVHGCYYPLSKTQLERQISTNDITKQVEKEQNKIMEETELEIQNLCETYAWLVDVHLYVGQWSRASLESMKDRPASLYEEHIKRVRSWAERVDAADSSLSTSNQMFVVHLDRTKETLQQQLRLIEEETQEHLMKELELLSESLVSDLEKDTAELKTQPQDLHDLSEYALTVRESVNTLADTQKRLEHIRSLRNTITTNYRKMTAQELTLERKVLGLWDGFIPLLKRADSLVCDRLPSMANALDTMFSFVVCDLQNVVLEATSGPFLNPGQNASEMVSKLSYMCAHACSLTAQMEQLSKNSENMQERGLDLTISTTNVQKVTARRALWELIAAYTTWLEEWKPLLFSEVVVSQAQEKVTLWKEQAQSLTDIIPPHDPVLEETLRILENLSHELLIMVKMQNATLKEKHHRAIFQDMGLLHSEERKVTVGDIMSQQLEIHQKQIYKICRDAQMECKMEQTLQKFRQTWEDRLFQLDKVSLVEPQNGLTERENTTGDSQHSSNDASITFIDLDMLFSEIGNHLMTLSTMLNSPYSVDFRLQLEEWIHSLQELEKQLVLLERYQSMWAFLTKVFGETSFSERRVDLLQRFHPVDKAFKEMMRFISTDPHVLNFVSNETNGSFHGNSLHQILLDGLSTMEAISNQMADVHDNICRQYPRLWFLSDREVIQLLSVPPAPLTLQPFVRKCFKPVHWLEVDCEIPSNTSDLKSCEASYESHEQLKVLGVFGSLREHVAFQSPVEPNLDALVWLCGFEKQLKLAMVHLIKQCAVVQNQSSQDLACGKKDRDLTFYVADRRKYGQSLLDLISEYPLQCLLVAEEAAWCSAVLQTFQESSPEMLRNLKANTSTKLKNLGRFIRGGVAGSTSASLVSKYTMMCLRALLQLTMKQSQQLSRLMEIQCALDSSFEWISLMKYHVNSENQNLKSSDDPPCYVDVLGHHFQYGFEYHGPEDWVMVNAPSTDQAVLGILLALASYKCGFVSGPCMSGKKNTVVQLGRALGQQVVVIQCYSNTRLGFVQQVLLGALQTGALLLLDSVDLLTQNVLSLLGQHLADIHRFFFDLRTNNRGVNKKSEDKTAYSSTDCRNLVDPEWRMLFTGKSVSASPSYRCVLISSKGYTSTIPESLRFSTRPVALTHPDYRVIAEVMLTSIGFSEAAPLSQRLVSFISLANDSRCLPGFHADVQSCFLGVLQKIISASEIHLLQAVRQRGLDETVSSQTTCDQPFEERQEPEKHFVFCSSHLSVVQGLLEETAIVKAVLSVLIPDHKKASQFYIIFKDTFPLACQFPFFQQHEEEAEKNPLQDAVAEELQQKRFCCDTEIISSALTLYQTMKFSQAVMLIGPPGSGKTTCYSALAGALNGLAAKALEHVLEHDNADKNDVPQADLQITTTNWSSVDTVVVFPNAMSHDEIFGYFCEKRGWQDGTVAKVLRDSQRRESYGHEKKSDEMQMAKWLVMDGEPLGQPGWLDHLTTLCNPQDPFQCLSSGERLQPQTHLKLLMEITDLCDASPSALTYCGVVYFTGTDLWKAVWRSEMDVLSFKYKLDQRIVKMWNRLAEDLFSRSLDLLGQKALTSAVHTERGSSKSPVHGLQEIMAFVSILHALLQHYGKEMENPESLPQIDKTGISHGANGQGQQELLSRNLFLLAYIWGFGGHLHSRHWPQFDLLVRQVLFTCRYKIVVPEEESVFEHFFSVDCKMFAKSPLANPVIPKYRKYTYLLNLMLEANRPVLLAGEPGSGKTTLCKTLLSFDKPHISLPASPLLRSRDLRTILKTMSCQRNRKGTMGPMTGQPGLLLFVDDLHEAPCDVFGTMSKALETLRQSISKGEILTFDAYHLNFLSSRSISYMATCCVSGLGNHHSNVVTSRLSRLFTVFVLPSRSLDVILSIHSPWLQMWLQKMPLECSSERMSQRIITATKYLHDAVRDLFRPTKQTPHFVFSHHDLQKVFQGMCLLQPDSNTEHPPSVLNIVRLWMHECMRTFGDRLRSSCEKKTLVSLVAKTVETHYGIKLSDEAQLESLHHPPAVASLPVHTLPMDEACNQERTADQSEIHKGYIFTETYPVSENICSQDTSLKSHPIQPQTLKQMEEIMDGLVYGPELSESLKSGNKQFECDCSYQGRDLDMLLQELLALMNRIDEGQKVDDGSTITTRYMVHRQGVSQLWHVLRALLMPGGHGVLFGSDGGTGRKTTVRLAARLAGHQLMEVHPGNEHKLHELLKEAGNETREDGVNVTVLVHEGISQSVRDELLLAMAQRAYPPLCTEDELRNLTHRATAEKNSRRYLMDSWMFEKKLSQVHRNVHVFLLMPFNMSAGTEMPSSNEPLNWTAQMSKALKLSCCVDVFQPWSKQALVEAAAQGLEAIHSEMESHLQMTKASLSAAMAGIHQSACRYASVLLRTQPFSPRTYAEFIAHFGFLCKHLGPKMQIKTNRVATVLSHWEVLNDTAVQCQQNLIRQQTKVAETQQHEEELVRAIDDQKKLLDKAREKCEEEDKKLYHIEEQINDVKKQVKPVFLSSLKIIKCLNPSDLEEVRRYRNPPEGVVKIMDAICLLFNHPSGWESAKQLLGQSNFFQEMEFFDRYSLTNEQLLQLGQIVHSPYFAPESVREVSKACESLCRWVQAVYECCRVQHQLRVRQQLEAQANEARGRLNLAEQRAAEARRRLEEVALQVRLVKEDLEEQLLQLHEAEISSREAAAYAEQLQTHVRDWTAAQDVDVGTQNAPGDALILAAIISYLGPFGPDVRSELLGKWKRLCETGSIDANPHDPRTSLFTRSDAAPPPPSAGFPIPLTERLQLPLGQVLGMKEWQAEETLSARLLVELLLWGHRRPWVRRWPLLTDAQEHLEISSRNWFLTGEKVKLEDEFGMVVCADDLELLDKLDQAAERGLRVLVTHVERSVPSPEFLAKLARPTGCCFPGFNQRVHPVHPDFCLVLSTHLPVKLLSGEIHASVLARVHVVDLSLSSEEIQELMLTQMLQSECRELLIQHLQVQNYNQLLREKRVKEEDALMDCILQSDTLLLRDSAFLPRVTVCQEALRNLQAELKQLREEREHRDSLLTAPCQLVRLAADFYRALQAVSRLSPSYYFSLHEFISVVKEAFIKQDRPLVSYAVGRVPETIVPEITNAMVVRLLLHYRPCLFKSHVAVLKLLLSLTLLQHGQLCSEAERLAFLRGLGDAARAEKPVPSSRAAAPRPLPSWISPRIHPELFRLDKIPSFNGLVASLCASPEQWREYLRFPSCTVVGTVPCRSHAHLSLVQRALLWKTVVPSCLEGLAQAVDSCHICPPAKTPGAETPHAGNVAALCRFYVEHKGPVVLTLPKPDGDAPVSVQPLRFINQLARCAAGTNEVQVEVISFGSVCDSELVLPTLDRAVDAGSWLVFNGCHLLDHWDDKVVARLSQLFSTSKEQRGLIHPSFHLWFVTQEDASCSVPAVVRMCALPLVCDSPWDLKEELSCSLQQLSSVTQPQSWSDDDVELLRRCAIFHSVLLQRQTYKRLGQGRLCHWTQEDLLALVDAHIHISSLCHDKMKVLQHIAVSLVHGAHVTDSADLEVVESVANICFSTMSPLMGSGPLILSEIISESGHFDSSRLLRVLDRGLMEPADVSDPVALGFSEDVAAEIIKINSHNLSALLQASQTPPGAAAGFIPGPNRPVDLENFGRARDRLQALKRHLSHGSNGTNTDAGASSPGPVRDLVQAEWDDLVDSVSSLLSQLQWPSQYPPTSTSVLSLADVSRLERRAELLGSYLSRRGSSASDPPGAYRLSAFRNARGFLVAVMREAAQVQRKYVSDMTLHFQVLCDSSCSASPPADAVCLCGLELKGARWDPELGALQDTSSPQTCPLPLLCVRAHVRSTGVAQNTSPCKSSYLTDAGNVQAAGASSSPQLPVYQCPLYLDEDEQDGGNWGLADVNVITKVPLRAELNPVLCSLRRVRLVSGL
ncbi:dynein heavy chain domain-containing protein 1 [Mugil cephalus]|uniref:dynein heavy chain domain-containing protein 1 n=1 Tax=Mugil cephalus TaxID=48193 RepID=UPI001FB7D659|nr:dynein heavy chain domain-containing protein 1 [Mugil cephalus]